MREVRISDVTMKEAAFTKALTLSFKEKLEIAKLLDRLGASLIEIEGISSPKADALRIKSIASIITNSIVAVPVKLEDDENAEQVSKALKDAPNARLQVQASVSPTQIEYIYHKKPNTMVEAIVSTVAKCTSLCSDVEFVAEDATRSDMEYLSSCIEKAVEAGATTVTLKDMAGKMLPEEFAQFITDLKACTPALEKVSLGISCSDELYMADACAIAGIIAGVDEVKASSYPLNVVSLDKVAKILATKNDTCQAQCGIHVTEIKRIEQQIARLCESADKKSAGVFSNSVEADETIVLTEHDSIEAVMQCVEKLGYDLPAEDAANVYEAFKRIAAKKDAIGSRELDAIVASAALQVPETYKLSTYVINSGNTIHATARVEMKKGEETLEAVCLGDGPIDAAFMAIEKIAGAHFELEDFQIQSVTEGQEAMGETIVKLVSGGKVYSGRGISTDIVGSSIRAYVNALNKIVYEEQN